MAGKGDRRRPVRVPTAVADANYETIFGKYVPLYLRKQIPDETTKLTKPKAEDNK